jgi:hypothetical protein
MTRTKMLLRRLTGGAMTRTTLLRALTGGTLIVLSLPALASGSHIALLAGVEIACAALYAWPRAPRWADAALAAVMAFAIALHALGRELAPVPMLAVVAIVALWRPRAITADDDDDRRALAVFTLRSAGELPHEMHVRVARLYLQQLPLGIAIERFSADLRRFAAAHGAAGKFHHTITVAFLLVIRARLAGAPENETFAAFMARNPDLASVRCLDAFYTKDALGSALARTDFVFPDRVATSRAAT